MSLRSLIGWPVKWALARAGYEVFRPAEYGVFRRAEFDVIPKVAYGGDPLLDIEKLSQTWRYSIDVFFDVGANTGGTILRAKHRFRNCRVTAFEPHPKTFLHLT